LLPLLPSLRPCVVAASATISGKRCDTILEDHHPQSPSIRSRSLQQCHDQELGPSD
jgi:hypothetical protein